MKANNVIMEVEAYEAPECQVINLECEYAILVGSGANFGSSMHDGFTEDEYSW
ncbi:MAG: hypothetical protein H9777_11475 [Candidatus Phocaeicola faecigallinarum]|uniref:Uncharacterized protein n=1 Tax=Candidatus Phocaeicola faecigallinarum TaxID=2838732 RepID=A0A948WZZ2_9BACT|nr:hypothetical protein [Candidatus Phocaeicola faecigallinarum]